MSSRAPSLPSPLSRRSLIVQTAIFVITGTGTTQTVFAVTRSVLDSINNITSFYDPNEPWCGSGGSGGVLNGSDNEQKAFNYFVSQGLSAVQSAGIIGNLMVESGMDPSITEGGKDSTTITPNKGYGIAQWTSAPGPNGELTGRQANLAKIAAQQGKPVNDLGVQLDFVWQELNGSYPNVLKQLKDTSNVDQAAII